jgi:phosphoglycolate phosphatase-like HAD superfamily hydrolase
MIKTIILDFDGTLCDTSPCILRTMRKTFEVMNIPLMEEQEIKQLIGLPLIEMFRRLTHLDEKGVELAAATYRAHFTDFAMGVAQPFPHVAETLKRLHEEGYKLAIATSRGRESLVMLLKELNLLQYFDEMATDQDVEEKKPAPGNGALSAGEDADKEGKCAGGGRYDI